MVTELQQKMVETASTIIAMQGRIDRAESQITSLETGLRLATEKVPPEPPEPNPLPDLSTVLLTHCPLLPVSKIMF
jgi:hypothetical protein